MAQPTLQRPAPPPGFSYDSLAAGPAAAAPAPAPAPAAQAPTLPAPPPGFSYSDSGQAQPALQAPQGRSWLRAAGDLGVSLGQGVVEAGLFVPQLANTLTGGAVDRYLFKPATAAVDRAFGGSGEGNTLAEASQQTHDALDELKSPQLRALEQQLSDTKGFLPTAKAILTHPALLTDQVAQQIPQFIAPGGVVRKVGAMALERAAGEALAKGVAKRVAAGMTEEAATEAAAKAAARVGQRAAVKAGAKAAVATEAAMSASQNSEQAQQQVLGMDEATLAKNPEYQAALAAGSTPQQAREQLAMKAGERAAAAGAAITAATGGLTAGLESRIFQGETGVQGVRALLTRQGAKEAAKAVGKEFTQEALQEGGEQVGQNYGVQAVDPNQSLMDQVPEQAALGGVIGGVTGGAMFAGSAALHSKLQHPRYPNAAPGSLSDAANALPDDKAGPTEAKPASAPAPAAAPQDAALQAAKAEWDQQVRGTVAQGGDPIQLAQAIAQKHGVSADALLHTPDVATPAPKNNGRIDPGAPPWLDPATGEVQPPTKDQLVSALADHIVRQYSASGDMRISTPAIAQAWGVPKQDVDRARSRATKMANDQVAAAERQAMQGSQAGRPAPSDQADQRGSNTVSMPLFITNPMKQELRTLGHTDADIAKMTPQQAHDILRAGEPLLQEGRSLSGQKGGSAVDQAIADQQRAADEAAKQEGKTNADNGKQPDAVAAAAEAKQAPAGAGAATASEGVQAPVANQQGGTDATTENGAAGAEAAAAGGAGGKAASTANAQPAEAGNGNGASTAKPAQPVRPDVSGADTSSKPGDQLNQTEKPPATTKTGAKNNPSDNQTTETPPTGGVSASAPASGKAPQFSPYARAAETVRVKLPEGGSINGRTHVDRAIADGYTKVDSVRAGDRMQHSLVNEQGERIPLQARQLKYAQEATGAAAPEAAAKPLSPAQKRTTQLLGAGEGETIRTTGMGADIQPGSTWRIERIEKNGTVHVTSHGGGFGSFTQTELKREVAKGATFERVAATKKPAPAPAPAPAAPVDEAAKPKVEEPAARVEQAAAQAASSPANDLPEPTDAQKEAGNYRKGHVSLHGLDISIENPRGSERSGTDPNGKAWSHTMSDHYGYIRRTTGGDGEQVDVYVGPKPESEKVFVVDQLDQKTGGFDEHKVMLGFKSQKSAVKAYRSNFDKGWKVGPVREMSIDEFKDWLKNGDTSKPAAEAAPAPAEPAAAPTPSSTAVNTGDAGAELWYSRRNRTGNGLHWSDIADLNDTLKVKEAVKSKVWPRPDYGQLVADGLRPEFAHLVKQVYDAIPTKPQTVRAPTDQQLQAYIETVGKIREAVFDYVRDGERVGATLQSILDRAQRMGGERVSLSDMAKRPENTKSILDAVFPGEGKSRWRNPDGSSNAANAAANLVGGNKIVRAMQIGEDEFAAAIKAVQGGWPAKQPAWKKLYKITVRNGTYQVSRAGRRIATDIATKDAAEAAAQAHYQENKKTGNVMAEEAQSVEKAKRVGPDHRAPGEDISSDRLAQTFGFRGVNFGNWMKGETAATVRERQLHLNHAYDAFMDLADITGLPAQALSLNGQLGLAFGAQGKGGRAAAHFIPGVNEINLTRRAGAGAIAHEWAHALDHYFAVQSGETHARSERPYLTLLSKSKREQLGVRPEISQAFQKIINAMEKRPLTPEEIQAREDRARAHGEEGVNRALAPARDALEKDGGTDAVTEFDALAERLRDGDVGEGRVDTGRQVPSLRNRRQKVPETIGQTAGQMVVLLRNHGVTEDAALSAVADADQVAHAIAYQKQAAEQRANQPKPDQITSNYLTEARRLESNSAKRGQAEAYWSTPWEMFARAFQSYAIDNLAQSERQNDYLSRRQPSEESVKALKEAGLIDGDMYPRAAERQRIGEAFRTLFSNIKTEPAEDGNVRLFRLDHATADHPEDAGKQAPFYSAALRAVEEAKGAPKKADAAGWSGWLDGAVRRGDMKQSEREWLGIDQWLHSQQGPVTREQLADYVRENQVQVRDVTLSSDAGSTLPDGWTVEQEPMGGYVVFDENGNERGLGSTPMEAKRDAQDPEERGSQPGDTKYDSYTMPGGRNYRELLLTLPEKSDGPMGDVRAQLERMQGEEFAADQEGRTADAARIHQEAVDLAARHGIETMAEIPADRANYRSSHFDQPNILAHVRFNERTDAAGHRVLFLEEIQSDWHQAGRRHGYQNDRPWEVFDSKSGQTVERYATRKEAEDATNRRGTGYDFAEVDASGERAVPDAPLKGTSQWSMAAFRRMVNYAAENGFDRIAWTTGSDQAERYNLSKQIASIKLTDNSSGGIGKPNMEGPFVHGMLTARDHDGREVIRHYVKDPAELPDLIGKEAADKLLSQHGVAGSEAGIGHRARELSGLDLEHGGEGMRAFYDKMLPKEVGKWAKPFGAKVGESELTTGEHIVSGEDVHPKTFTAHSMEITPAMREAALGGLPLFRQDAHGQTEPMASDAARAHAAKLRQAAELAVGRWKGRDVPGVRVVATPKELPAHARFTPDGRPDNAYKRAAGFYDGRSIYVVASAHRGPDGLRKMLTTIAHEAVGHYGVDRIVTRELGADAWKAITSITERLRKDSSRATPAMREVLASVTRRYGAKTDADTFARETLAVMAERGVRNGLLDRVVTALRRWARKLFPSLKLGESDLRQLLVKSSEYLERGPTYAQRVAAQAAMSFSRDGWSSDFPDAVVAHRPGFVRDHPDYAAAKAGDAEAALRLARDAITPDFVDRVRQAIPAGEKPVIVPVQALESTGSNMIPTMSAEVLAQRLGTTADTNVMQAEKVSRTGSDAMHRLANQPTFAGDITPGQSYVLLDDTLAQGGTMAQLKTHIERAGGKVVLATALTAKDYSRTLALDPKVLGQVRERFGRIEGWWRKHFGYGFEGLTASEARAILNYDKGRLSPDALRARILASKIPELSRMGEGAAGDRPDTGAPGAGAGPKRDFSLSDQAAEDQRPRKNANFQNASASIESIGEQLPKLDESTLQRAKDWFAGKTRDFEPMALGGLQLRHVLELAADTRVLEKPSKAYAELFQRMDGDRNALTQEGAAKVDSLVKWARERGAAGWAGKIKPEAKDLFKFMHAVTQLGIDPTSEYQRLTMRDSRGEEMPWTQDLVKERIRAIRGQMRGRAGDDKAAMIDEIKDLQRLPAREAARKQKYPELVAAWNALTPEAREQFMVMRDHYRQQSEALEQATVDHIQSLDIPAQSKRAAVDLVRRNFADAKVSGVYFPLMRFGDYWISAQTKDGEYMFAKYESSAEQERAAKQLQAAGATIDATGRQDNNYRSKDAPSGTFMGDLMGVLRAAKAPEAVQDQIYQMYLKTLPELSLKKRGIHRKNIAGYTDDVPRAFASSVFHGAHQLSKARYGWQLQNTLEHMRGTVEALRGSMTPTEAAHTDSLLGEINRRHDWILNPTNSKLSNAITSVGFAYFLSASPASALVNLIQVPQIVLPVLGAQHGWGSATRVLSKTMRDAFRTGGNIDRVLTGEDLQAFKALQQQGTFQRTATHSLAGIAEGDSLRSSPVYTRVLNAVSWMFHTSEVINREGTGIAAFRLAREKGMSFNDAVKYADQITNGTHGDYSNANRARYMQGNVAKVALQFKNYSLAMSWLWGRQFYKAFKGETPEVRATARRTLTGLLGMTGLFAGVVGMPIFNALRYAAQAVHAATGDDDQPWDFMTEFRSWLAEHLGQTAASVIADGPVSQLGANVASRVSMSDLWFREPDRQLEGEDAYNNMLQSLAGPLGGLVKNMYVGAQQFNEGHTWRGIETMLPSAAKNAMKAVRYAKEGVNTLRGDPIVPDVSAPEELVQALGFQPTRIADQQRINSALMNYQQFIQDRRQGLLNAFALALQSGDDDGRREVLQRIAAFNERYPEIAIRSGTLRSSLRTRARRSAEADNGIMLNRKIAGRVRQEVGAMAD